MAKENESDFVFKYFIRRMRMAILDKKHWDTWQNILFATAFAESGNLREVFEQLDLYQRIGYRINQKGLHNLLEIKASNELKGGISSELSWVIFGFLKFGIKPSRDLIEKILVKGDDISRILAIKLASEKHISFKKKSMELLNILDRESAVSEHWLLFWELYINNWINDNKMKSVLLSEKIFQFLNEKSVSFLREPQVDLLEVPEPFRRKIEETSGKHGLSDLLKKIKSTFHDLSEEDKSVDYDDEDIDFLYDGVVDIY